MFKRVVLAVVFAAVAAFTTAGPVAAHTRAKAVKVNTSTTAEGLRCNGSGCVAAVTGTKTVKVNTSTTAEGLRCNGSGCAV